MICTASASAQSNYVAFQLDRDRNWEELVVEDMNGDGRMDLVVPYYDSALGRELHIYHQLDNNSFASTPQRIEVKTEIIAAGFADLRPDPGMELLFFANNGVFSLSTASTGYTGNIKQLIEWDMIAAVPELDETQFIRNLKDIDGDGHVELLLPGEKTYGVFRGLGDEQFQLLTTFSTINTDVPPAMRNNYETDLDARLSINSEEGVVIELSAETPSPFNNFIEQWSSADIPNRRLLRAEQWMPGALFAQLNGDQRWDLVYQNMGIDGLGQLNIHLQQQDGSFAEKPDWHGSIDARGDLRLAHLDGDGQLDLYRISGDGDEWEARFYRNTGGSFDLERPNQVMRFSGYDLDLDFLSLVEGAPPFLNASFYTIPVIDAIRNASINRTQLLYRGMGSEANELFSRRPDSRLEENFSADNVRGLSEQMSLRYDVDGDGRRDALYITNNGTLAARRINDQLQIALEPFWEYVSPRTVFEFDVLSLNGDDRPDLILRHGSSTTILVATP
ncbi:MAG: hypothetical protein RL120_16735 [Gammaproteobacteria bacterium]